LILRAVEGPIVYKNNIRIRIKINYRWSSSLAYSLVRSRCHADTLAPYFLRQTVEGLVHRVVGWSVICLNCPEFFAGRPRLREGIGNERRDKVRRLII